MNGLEPWRAPTWLSILVSAMALAGAASAVAAPETAPPQPADPRRSGYADMRPGTRAMQEDDAQNPGMLWLQTGTALWRQPVGSAARSCADCHGGDAAAAMRGVASRYPAFDAASQRPLTLGQRINQCRVQRQGAAALRSESDELLGLETLVGQASRGLPLAPDDDPRLAPWTERGRGHFERRIGQLNLSCTQCHDQLAGGRLGGSLIPQGHPTGYPQYRLEWQGLGTLQRRLRNCLSGVRAEPWADGAPQWTELELYLKRRAAGMPVETPAVRP